MYKHTRNYDVITAANRIITSDGRCYSQQVDLIVQHSSAQSLSIENHRTRID